MSEFWWGVLALPIIAASVGAAFLLLFGGWYFAEQWFEKRFSRLNPGWHRDSDFGNYVIPNSGRLRAASLVLLARKAFRIRIGFGAYILLIGGSQHVGWRAANRSDSALRKALSEVVEGYDKQFTLPPEGNEKQSWT